MRHERPKSDRVLLGTVIFLCLFGLLMVYSSSAILASVEASSQTAYLRSQVPKLILGILSLAVLSRLPYYKLKGKAAIWAVCLAGLALVVLLLPLGLTAGGRGTRRFLDVGFLQVQPAEFARIAIILFVADFVSRREDWIESGWRGLLTPVGAIAVLAGLIVLQPNLSSALLLAGLGFVLLFLAGQPIRRLLMAVAPMALLALALRPYQLKRLADFFGGGDGPLPYQVEQSLIAVGSGGLWGKGLGQGLQKFFYLPFPHTDFILGVVGEELGFVGVGLLFVVYGLIIVRGLRIARLAPDVFSQLLAAGLTLSLTVNFLLHSVVVLGIGPVTGVPLPFLSHGGTSLLANLMAIGILLSISRSLDRPSVSARSERWHEPWIWTGRASRAE